jgi:hypothetical protein
MPERLDEVSIQERLATVEEIDALDLRAVQL